MLLFFLLYIFYFLSYIKKKIDQYIVIKGYTKNDKYTKRNKIYYFKKI